MPTLLSILLWPILIIFIWKELLGIDKVVTPLKGYLKKKRAILRFKREVHGINCNKSISLQELASLHESFFDFLEGRVTRFAWPDDLVKCIREFWAEGLPPSEYFERRFAKIRSQQECSQAETTEKVFFKIAEPEWYIGMTDEFSKNIRNIDRKIQGRILEAINDIIKDPTSLRGDTVKPLTGNLNGFWRYRIGDFRLVYQPNKQSRLILLHTFASRGDIYNG